LLVRSLIQGQARSAIGIPFNANSENGSILSDEAAFGRAAADLPGAVAVSGLPMAVLVAERP